MQKQLDSHEKAIFTLQQREHETQRLLADYQNDVDKIRIDIQSLKGSIEQNSHYTEKEISDLRAKVEDLLRLFNEKQKLIQQLQDNVAPAASGTQREPESESYSKEEDFYNQALNYFQKGDFKNSRMSFEKFCTDYPNSPLIDNALYWAGNCYFKEKQFEKAISVFDDVIKKYPQGNKVPDAYYLQALSFLGLNDQLSAQLILETLLQNYPTSKQAAPAKQKYEELKSSSHQ
jgi:tol-pal system protein YbgF